MHRLVNAWGTKLSDQSHNWLTSFEGQVSLKTGQLVESNRPAEECLLVGNFRVLKSRSSSQGFDVLSAGKQCGGERSVSTIMYLMAMQDLMVSPFRFVDKINQRTQRTVGLSSNSSAKLDEVSTKRKTDPPATVDIIS